LSSTQPRGESADALRADLLAAFDRPFDDDTDDTWFGALAMRVFAHQFTHNHAYAAYCRRRRATPADVTHWSMIPVVPTAAFRALPLVAGAARDAQAVFRTSGTTAGRARRGSRYMLDLALYHAAALSFFRVCVLPDAAALPFYSLVPPAAELPDSSLAHMITLVCERFGAPGSACFASVERGLHVSELLAALEAAQSAGTAVCLLGTSTSFVLLLEHLERSGRRCALPPGSRLMDTGGYKGVGREVEPAALRAWYHDRLGLDADHCVNEYGMTELCSQFYDVMLRERVLGTRRAPRKVAPRWVRSRVVDPVTLAPLAPGAVGILQHFDLASMDAVLAVQTEDLARSVADGFELLGRVTGAPPRGCSIAMDELLRAARSP
jgi:hypothetical protein